MVFSKILINNDVEKWFDTSNFDNNDNRPLLIGKNKSLVVNLEMNLVAKY